MRAEASAKEQEKLRAEAAAKEREKLQAEAASREQEKLWAEAAAKAAADAKAAEVLDTHSFNSNILMVDQCIFIR